MGRTAVRPTSWSREIATAALCVVLFAAQWALGANNTGLALTFSLTVSTLLALALVLAPWARRALAEAPRAQRLQLAIPAAGVLALGLMSLTPALQVAPDLWKAAGVAPAGTLDRSSTVIELLKLAGVACAFALAAAIGAQGSRTVDRFMQLSLFGFAAYAVWALSNYQADPRGVYGLARALQTDRLAAAFSSPNSAALFFGFGLLLSLTSLFRRLRRLDLTGRDRFERAALAITPALVVGALCAACVVLSQSRAGVAVVVAGALLLAAWEGSVALRAGRGVAPLLICLAGLLAVAALLALFFHHDRGLQRFAATGDDWRVRLHIYAEHARAAAAAPWTGYGAGTFDRLNVIRLTPANYRDLWEIRAAHNVYLHQVLSFGLVGAALLVVLFGALGLRLVRAAARDVQGAGWLKAVLCCSLLVLAHGVTDYGLEEPSIALYWAALLGLATGLTWTSGHRAQPAR